MSSNTQKPASSAVIEVGDIFKIEADEENGITPPLGRLTWYSILLLWVSRMMGAFLVVLFLILQ